MNKQKIASNIETMDLGVLDKDRNKFDELLMNAIKKVDPETTIAEAIMSLPMLKLRKLWNNLLLLDYNEEVERHICWKCQDREIVQETVCAYCQDGTPHSSCDDTWYVDVPCDACTVKQK